MGIFITLHGKNGKKLFYLEKNFFCNEKTLKNDEKIRFENNKGLFPRFFCPPSETINT